MTGGGDEVTTDGQERTKHVDDEGVEDRDNELPNPCCAVARHSSDRRSHGEMHLMI